MTPMPNQAIELMFGAYRRKLLAAAVRCIGETLP